MQAVALRLTWWSQDNKQLVKALSLSGVGKKGGSRNRIVYSNGYRGWKQNKIKQGGKKKIRKESLFVVIKKGTPSNGEALYLSLEDEE